MKYLFDLDVISALFQTDSPFHEIVVERFQNLSKEDELYLSVLTLYELHYSHANTDDENKKYEISEVISSCHKDLKIVPLDAKDAEVYGRLKAKFKARTGSNRKAMKRHNIDLMLASTALAKGLTLVAKDQIYREHLADISDLSVDDWTIFPPA